MIGESVLRKEDRRLVTGRGQYFEDVQLSGMMHVAFVRSVHPHAHIRRVNREAALDKAGVRAVLTVDDYPEFSGFVPELMEAGTLVNPYCDYNHAPPRPLLARTIKYVGEIIAIVVAETPYAAADGVEAVEVEYELLPAYCKWDAAFEAEPSAVHDGYKNYVAHLRHEIGDVDGALATADVVFSERLEMQSLKSMAIECRGSTAAWDPVSGTLSLWSTSQYPYMVRDCVARSLALSPEHVRVRARDIGGGFGLKGAPLYPEDVLVPIVAHKLGCPVRWSETRSEHMTSSNQSGHQVHDVRVAAKSDGVILAVDVKIYKDVGAYNHFEMVCPTNTINHMPLQYRVPSIRAEGWSICTHTVPASPYRGAGRLEATFTMDRILDRIARETGLDPLEVRQRNIISAEEMPFKTGLTYRDGVPVRYEGTDFPSMLDAAIARVDYAGWRRRQQEGLEQGRAIGIGKSSYMEAGGVGPCEGATIKVEESGRVNVLIGVNSQGQSHETTFAQVCATHLGAKFDDVFVSGGDTQLIPFGFGTVASRVGVNTGNAVHKTAVEVRRKAIVLAAHLLGCNEGDLEIENGVVAIPGENGKGIGLGELAAKAHRHPIMKTLGGPGLSATEYFYPRTVTWSSGFHVAVVEVDKGTGEVKILKYVITHDCGVPLNPMVVDGQIYGGFAQGLGAALGEEVVYDDEGQLVSGSMMDYYVPRAIDVPNLEVEHFVFPTEENPLGVRSVGESGPISPPAALVSAVEDAIGNSRRITTIPLTRGKIMRLLDDAGHT